MTGKELMYVEDALGHLEFLKTQCQEAESTLQDPQLKTKVNEACRKNTELFGKFYGLV